jgi:hypothetical protein
MLHPNSRDECPDVGVRPMDRGLHLSAWLRAVGRHWKRELLGGALIGVLALFSELSGITVPPRIYEVAAVAVLFYAMFLAWRDEYSSHLTSDQTVVDLRGQLDRVIKGASTLKVKIQRVNPSFEFEGSPLSGGSAILFDVTISNSGSPTVIRDWELKVNDKTYKPAAVRIDVNGSLLVKPLELGGHRGGQVWFVISDINLEQANALLREAWELTFCDVTGRL